MASRKGEVLVAVGTAAVLLPILGIGLVLSRNHQAPRHPSHPVSLASPSAGDLSSADPSISALPLPSLAPSVAPVAVPSVPVARSSSTPRPTAAPPQFAGSWPNYRMTTGQTGYDASETTLNSGNVSRLGSRWMAPVGTQASPTIANGLLYAGGGANGLMVFAAAGCGRSQCDPLWTGDTGMDSQGPSATVGSPVAGADRVYVVVAVHMETWLYAYPARGCGATHCAAVMKQQLSHNTSTQANTSNAFPATGPALAGGVVYVTAQNSGTLFAFDERGCGQPTCTPLWTGALGSDPTVPPSVDDGMVYVDPGPLVAFPAAGCGSSSCSPAWSASVVATTPAATGGRVYVTGGGTARCLDGHTGAQLWSTDYAPGSFTGGSPMVGDGMLLATAGSTVYALDASSGAVRWTADAGANVSAASPTGGNGLAYVDTGGDRLVVLAVTGCGAATCAPLWSTTSNDGGSDGSLHQGFNGPVVAGGTVFLGQPDGLLRTFVAS